MPINFPAAPAVDDEYTYGDRTWKWNGNAWESVAISGSHEAAADPHIQYQKESEKGTAGGYASLDGSGQVPAAQIPAIAITEYLGAAANQAAMLALSGQKGDWCTRTDLGTNWVITGNDPTQLASWTALTYPASPVTSVNSETGAVVLDATDVGAVAKTVVDAKGDLLVGTAADTVGRLAVGTNGHVLTADSAEASGVKWAAASGGGGAAFTSGLSDPSGGSNGDWYLRTDIGSLFQNVAGTWKRYTSDSSSFISVYDTVTYAGGENVAWQNIGLGICYPELGYWTVSLNTQAKTQAAFPSRANATVNSSGHITVNGTVTTAYARGRLWGAMNVALTITIITMPTAGQSLSIGLGYPYSNFSVPRVSITDAGVITVVDASGTVATLPGTMTANGVVNIIAQAGSLLVNARNSAGAGLGDALAPDLAQLVPNNIGYLGMRWCISGTGTVAITGGIIKG